MKKVYFSIILVLALTLSTPPNICNADKDGENKLKPVLLVIDIQNKYLAFIPDQEKKVGLEMINGAIWVSRQHDLPIVRIYNTHPEWGPEPGSEEFEFPSTVNVTDDDPQVTKNYASAFQQTELQKLLEEYDCDTIFLCGLSAVGCVLATYFGGMERDYNVMMVKDAIMSHNPEYTNVIEEICETVSLNVMDMLLQGARE